MDTDLNKKKKLTALDYTTLGAQGLQVAGQFLENPYDQRVGVEKPNLLKSMTDTTFTQLGSAFGGVGAAVGGALDIGKNIYGHMAAKAQYGDALNKYSNAKARENHLRGIEDYTNFSRYGKPPKNMMYGGVNEPVVMENNEIVLNQNPDGSYNKMMQTPSTAPTHEQGGVKATLPEDAIVMPGKYTSDVNTALNMGDNQAIDGMVGQMSMEAQAAADANMPYSNQNLKKKKGLMSTMGNPFMMRYGGKMKY